MFKQVSGKPYIIHNEIPFGKGVPMIDKLAGPAHAAGTDSRVAKSTEALISKVIGVQDALYVIVDGVRVLASPFSKAYPDPVSLVKSAESELSHGLEERKATDVYDWVIDGYVRDSEKAIRKIDRRFNMSGVHTEKDLKKLMRILNNTVVKWSYESWPVDASNAAFSQFVERRIMDSTNMLVDGINATYGMIKVTQAKPGSASSGDGGLITEQIPTCMARYVMNVGKELAESMKGKLEKDAGYASRIQQPSFVFDPTIQNTYLSSLNFMHDDTYLFREIVSMDMKSYEKATRSLAKLVRKGPEGDSLMLALIRKLKNFEVSAP